LFCGGKFIIKYIDILIYLPFSATNCNFLVITISEHRKCDTNKIYDCPNQANWIANKVQNQLQHTRQIFAIDEAMNSKVTQE